LHSAQIVAPLAAEKEPAAHSVHAEPLRKLPARHVAVPAKVTPPGPSVHVVLATELPSAKQRREAPSNVTAGVAKEYVAVVAVVSVAVAVAAVQPSDGVPE
jgi:hypothetical protein